MVVPTVPPERPAPFWIIALAGLVCAAAVAGIILAAPRIDSLEPAAVTTPLPNRCTAPVTEGARLVVEFTLRGTVIDIKCRPLPAVQARVKDGKS